MYMQSNSAVSMYDKKPKHQETSQMNEKKLHEKMMNEYEELNDTLFNRNVDFG